MPNWNHIVRERLAVLRLSPQREGEIVEEIALHLEAIYDEALLHGLSETAAQTRAVQTYDWRLLECELSRAEETAFQSSLELIERTGGIRMESLLQDLRFGARMLAKQPGFTLVAVLTLALGIGANTAIFSVVNALLLEPLPYYAPERLVMLGEKSRNGNRSAIPYPNFEDWRTRAQSFEAMASIRSQALNLTGVDKPVQLRGRTVNWNFFQVLGVNPQIGRSFTVEDDRYGAARTAMLSHGMWKERFGGDVNIIGKKLLLDTQPYEVIGVLPPGFEYFRADDVYVPIGLFLQPNTGLTDRGTSMGLYAVARLKPGVTVAQANSEIAAICQQLTQEYPKINAGRRAQVERLQDVMAENVSQTLWVLLGAVGFILLIACVNVANLLLVRAADRQKEIAVRLALGAGRGRIVRQLLSESLLIAGLGGAVGLLFGYWMLTGLLTLAPATTPNLSRVGLDQMVLLFTLGVAFLTSLLSGTLPAWHAARADLQTTLKEGGRAVAGSSRERLRKTLLVVEVSLALVLLAGAGLLVRSMSNLLHVDPGFETENLLTMRFSLRGERYDAARRRVFYDEALARVAALPGVRAAGLTASLPIEGSNWNQFFIAADKPVPSRPELPDSANIPVSANYFTALGLRLVNGRLFTNADSADSAPVVIINETLAHRMWPGENPIGKRIKQGYPENESPWREVIGVVNDVKLNGLERTTPMETYVPITQESSRMLGMVVRTVGNPLAMATAVEQAMHEIDKDLPISQVLTMDQLLGNSLAQRKLTLVLLASFAALALLLAAIGIYGVIAYSVRQRTHELGIRMALGAVESDVLRLILSQGLRLALIGVGLGLLAALALTRWLESLLFGVRPADPLTLVVVAAVLLCVALLACWLPARQATRVDPLAALRHD